ncbi:DUF6074 family protein [Chelativorans alearense]|uniref:DUF6074 family protein n=1 Tax=Chelativorans alearense TaxID=2681495 RepID=UPI0013CFE2C7|nr:DUF6074 family protein [Chelativorans alearense]
MQLELDLKAQVLGFPLARRVATVKHVARTLDMKHGSGATAYWRSIIASEQRHLSSIGLSEDEIDRQLLEFFDAVQMEIFRADLDRGLGRGVQPASCFLDGFLTGY